MPIATKSRDTKLSKRRTVIKQIYSFSSAAVMVINGIVFKDVNAKVIGNIYFENQRVQIVLDKNSVNSITLPKDLHIHIIYHIILKANVIDKIL